MADAGDDRSLVLLLPRPVRTLPADLASVVVLVLLATLAAVVPGVRETPVRILFGLPLVLFLPGYAFVAALFPEAGESPTDGSAPTTAEGGASTDGGSGIDGIERVALSFGLSIAIVPLIGLVLNFTPWGIRLGPILVGVGGFTVVAVAVAARRRRALPPQERFSVPYRRWIADGRQEFFDPESRTDALLNVLLALSVLLAVASVTYAIAVPREGEAFTEFYLLTENDEGELVADDYPTEFTVGESRPIVVGVGNHEHEPTRYTVVTEIQNVQVRNNSTRVLSDRELDRFVSPTLQSNETWHRTHSVTPTMTGRRLRLTYMLYRESAPSDATVESAYRETHLWVNVTS